MDKLSESLRELTIQVQENENLTNDEWNQYASENSYYSSTTIEAHINVENWNELKKKISPMAFNDRNINKEIEKLRKKLHKSIEETSLHSNKTRELSRQINLLSVKYYRNNRNKKKGKFYKEDNFMNSIYNKSYEHLKGLTSEISEFPSIHLWNQYAKENFCLNSQSLEYISRYELA